MDPEDRRLFDAFIQKKGLGPRAPAWVRTAEELSEGLRRVQALLAEGPSLRLTTEDRADLAGDRVPELQGIVEMLARGLERHPAISRSAHAGPEELLHAVRLDRAIGNALFAAQLLFRGGERGRLAAAEAAGRLCRDLLGEAEARKDRGADPKAACVLRAAFAEPQRLAEEMRARPREDTAGAGTAPSGAAPDGPAPAAGAAEDPAAVARFLGRLLSDLGRRP